MIKELDGNFLTRFLFLLFSFSTLTKRNQGKKRKMELFVGSIIHQWCGLTANYAEIWDDTTHFHFFCWCDIWRNKLFLSCLTVFAKLLGSSNKHDSMMRQFHVTIFPDSSRQLVWVWSFFATAIPSKSFNVKYRFSFSLRFVLKIVHSIICLICFATNTALWGFSSRSKRKKGENETLTDRETSYGEKTLCSKKGRWMSVKQNKWLQ